MEISAEVKLCFYQIMLASFFGLKGTGGSVRVCRFFISNYFYLQDIQNLLYYSHGNGN